MLQQVERVLTAPDLQVFLQAIADAGGCWQGYVVDKAAAEARDLAAALGLIEVTGTGGGFDYAEQHRLLPKGYLAIGRVVPHKPPSPTERIVLALRRWFQPFAV